MPTFFRRRSPLGVGWRRQRFLPASAPALRPAVFAIAGTATVPVTAISVFNATFAISGVADLSGVGVGIRSGALSASGVATFPVVGTAFATTVLSSAGVAAAAFVRALDQITSTNALQKPVDGVLMGQQDTFRRGRAPRSALRRIFRE